MDSAEDMDLSDWLMLQLFHQLVLEGAYTVSEEPDGWHYRIVDGHPKTKAWREDSRKTFGREIVHFRLRRDGDRQRFEELPP